MSSKTQPLAALVFLTLLASFPLSARAEVSGDSEAGRILYQACRGCHEIGRRAKHKMGPHLNGLFGRIAGRVDGYRFSLPMIAAGIRGLVWEDDTLEVYLIDPQAFVPHTRMPHVGLPEAQDRADLIAYLRAASLTEEKARRAEAKLSH